ncbi:MAG: hypothetical protein LC104_16895 [Bacteroidales bacterium]|nr:hypothetical protein [Bacteroidales bacterium]
MSQTQPLLLRQLQPGQPAECFARLTERVAGQTRDGKPYFSCTFRDKVRMAVAKIWADHALFARCAAEWEPGQYYRLRAIYSEHDRYGPQLDVLQLRPITDADREAGFRESDFVERSRFDSEAMFVELRDLAQSTITDEPLRQLVVLLLDRHADVIKLLPAHPRAFFPFPGGWLEHTLSVTRSALWLTERYLAHYPELVPPLNRDLIAAGAVLHEIGRVAELVPGEPDASGGATDGSGVGFTVLGQLFGPAFLARDLVRDAAREIENLNPELLLLLEHLIVTHLTLPEWGSPRLPAIPEVLILHHADDLDAKLEMYTRCLLNDSSDGPFTASDAVLKRRLLKQRTV